MTTHFNEFVSCSISFRKPSICSLTPERSNRSCLMYSAPFWSMEALLSYKNRKNRVYFKSLHKKLWNTNLCVWILLKLRNQTVQHVEAIFDVIASLLFGVNVPSSPLILAWLKLVHAKTAFRRMWRHFMRVLKCWVWRKRWRVGIWNVRAWGRAPRLLLLHLLLLSDWTSGHQNGILY